MRNSTTVRAARPRRVAQRQVRGREVAVESLGRQIFPRNGYTLALWVMLVLSISRIHQHLTFLAPLRPALLAALAAFAFALMKPSLLSMENLRTKPARYMILLVVMACLSVPFGISIGNSGKFLLEIYFRVVLAYVLLTLAIRSRLELQQYVWGWVLSCGILAWMATSVFQLKSTHGVARLSNLYTYDANDIGVILVIGIPLILAVIDTSKRTGKIIGLGVLGWTGVALARSGSRGAFVGLLLLVPVFLVWVKHIPIRHRLAAVGLIAGALLVAAPTGYWEQMRSLTKPTEDYNWESETGRRKVAQRGLGYMAEHPLTGLGVDNFGKAEWTISDMAQDRYRARGIKGSAAHNTWLQAGAEMGVPGLFLWCLMVFGTLIAVGRERLRMPASWRDGDYDQRFLFALATYLPLSILGFAATSTFVSFAYNDPMYYLAAMSAGLVVVIRRKRFELAQFSALRGSE